MTVSLPNLLLYISYFYWFLKMFYPFHFAWYFNNFENNFIYDTFINLVTKMHNAVYFALNATLFMHLHISKIIFTKLKQLQ